MLTRLVTRPLKPKNILSSLNRRDMLNWKLFRTIKTTSDDGPIKQQPEMDYVEQDICGVDDISENQMKQFDLGESRVLLIKQKGVLSAIGTKCSHYGALLSTGALGDGRVRCPWHGACFNIRTGDIEDFPGQDSIPCYKVNVVEGQVRVRARRSDLEANKRVRDMVKYDPTNEQCFVIVGGGPSGGICAETLRQQGFTGRIVMVCKEAYLPYDRIKVSKAMDFNIHKTEFRTKDFYEEFGIEAMTGVEATRVDSANKKVTLSNGYIIKYDKMYVATGSQAKKVPVPGADLQNVMTMRNYEDAAHVQSLLTPDKHVVCLGLSFIGLEAAAYCVNKVAKVTVVGRDSVLLRHSFGPEVGKRIQDMFEQNNIEFILENGIKRCIGTDGVVTAVELNDGRQLPCDICIMGTGSSLYTKFLDNSGINVNKDGSINTNLYLQTNDPDVYVGGDIANAPVYSIGNKLATIGHYPLAQYHGRMAGVNMAGTATEIRCVPYFWTVLFGKSFRYSGYGVPHETQIEGSLEDLKFVAIYYDKDGRVCGMASCQRDPIVSQFAELQAQGKSLHKANLTADPFGWTSEIVPKS
ncbi:apoptosis-inducing factor 3 isoform X2 [Bradysia coprophila]|uniref:apoptosis-inducing factor 3 isoform X2 n=1 Tax=Bradysia coprophila TaxID=38358 RepID=UPI00187DA05F|nr:apoptosis-inducing factor 3 isoform X2 [Bradysia coprophila]